MESSEPILYDRITLDHDWKTDSETREVQSANALQTAGQTWLPGIFGRVASFLRASGISSNSPSQFEFQNLIFLRKFRFFDENFVQAKIFRFFD